MSSGGEKFNPYQAAEYLGMKAGTVYDLCKAGRIRHYRVGPNGGRILFDRADLDAYLESCAVEVEPDAGPDEPGLRHLRLPGRPRRA